MTYRMFPESTNSTTNSKKKEQSNHSLLKNYIDVDVENCDIDELQKLQLHIQGLLKLKQDTQPLIEQLTILYAKIQGHVKTKPTIKQWSALYPNYYSIAEQSTKYKSVFNELFEIFHKVRSVIEDKFHTNEHNRLISHLDDFLPVKLDALERFRKKTTFSTTAAPDHTIHLSTFLEECGVSTYFFYNTVGAKSHIPSTLKQIAAQHRYEDLNSRIDWLFEILSTEKSKLTSTTLKKARDSFEFIDNNFKSWSEICKNAGIDVSLLVEKCKRLHKQADSRIKKATDYHKNPAEKREFLLAALNRIEKRQANLVSNTEPDGATIAALKTECGMSFTTVNAILTAHPELKERLITENNQRYKNISSQKAKQFLDNGDFKSLRDLESTFFAIRYALKRIISKSEALKVNQQELFEIKSLLEQASNAYQTKKQALSQTIKSQATNTELTLNENGKPNKKLDPIAIKLYQAIALILASEKKNPTGFKITKQSVCKAAGFVSQSSLSKKLTPDIEAVFNLVRDAEMQRRLNYLGYILNQIEKNPSTYITDNGYNIGIKRLLKFAGMSRDEYRTIHLPLDSLFNHIDEVQITLIKSKQDAKKAKK